MSDKDKLEKEKVFHLLSVENCLLLPVASASTDKLTAQQKPL